MKIRLDADEFSVRIPSTFRTEVRFDVKEDESIKPTQFMATEIQFNDFENYRMVSSSVTTIKSEMIKDGLNLTCGQSETIVVDGQVLSLGRQPEYFQGEVPNNSERLEAIIKERCQNLKWSVSFSTTHDLPNSLGRLHGLVTIVGSLDFLNQDRSAFSITKSSILKRNGETVEANIQDKKDAHRLTLQKWEEGWRVSQMNSTYSSPSMTGKYTIRSNDSGLEMETHWTKTTDTRETFATVRLTNMQFGGPPSIALTRPITNGTPVSLKGSPQIKAVWNDGKVVRIYEGGTVDDLGSPTFRTATGSSGFARVLWITFFLAVVGGAVSWLRRKPK